ncbi:PhaM family polyhydroxyalkanoate granule multifunctional regulatory protein [Variovorax sp. RT4R15]|uniref:PhaM family polyhydroxyalkanoate granule multifunctional regulatory protein n=1 Tax=Variovorax sp. RT4R15 TaxID=3443737 RepID=UPI003F45B014
MTDAAKPFNFANFVPGFDFLKNLTTGGAAGAANAVPGLSGLASWVAPTLSVEEVDKRIQELKTVQFWLDQNLNALKATIQALEVQKMTLSTLKGMNVRMEDLANSFTRAATVASQASPRAAAPVAAAPEMAPPPPVPTPAAPAPEPAPEPDTKTKGKAASAAPTAGVVDPLQWWGALTQQFEQIASGALRDAASLKVPSMLQSAVDQASDAVKQSVSVASGKKPAAAKKTPSKPAAKRAAPKRR